MTALARAPAPTAGPLGWPSIFRLGLVQSAIGAIVMLSTSLLNRVMVVEYALPAALPAGLVAWHYAVQLTRPAWGHGSDRGRRRTPWIIVGMAVLALGALLAVYSLGLLAGHAPAGYVLAIGAFAMIGAGVGAAGTSLLALLATQVAPERRAGAAAVTWIMMILGIAGTAGVAGSFIDPFTYQRLVMVVACVAGTAFVIAALAVLGVEAKAPPNAPLPAAEPIEKAPAPSFKLALREMWADDQARRFTFFVFLSMLAYSMQDLILEPFAGLVFAFTPGQSTQLSGVQHGGVLAGMILVGVGAGAFGGRTAGGMTRWIVAGCVGSAIALAGLGMAARAGPGWPLSANIVLLGFANGVFAVAAIGRMMGLAGAAGNDGNGGREGIRMGVWGAAQAIAFGAGGLIGAVAVDLGRALSGSTSMTFSAVFGAEALLFVAAAAVALFDQSFRGPKTEPPSQGLPAEFDCIVVGGGPAGATAATDLARQGRHVMLLDRGGRIKPCGGAIPPRLIADFAIPDHLIVSRASSARMISPAGREVDMPVGGYVGMVDRGPFDEWLRGRAALAGATRVTGRFERLDRDPDGCAVAVYNCPEAGERRVRTRCVIGADGARSEVARSALTGTERMPYVFAYHEIVQLPVDEAARFDHTRADVYYQAELSPDFYAWIFPHGDAASVGVGSANKGFALRGAVSTLRERTGLADCATIRREGAPIPLKPLRRWDNGRDVLVTGDAAGVVAPASGEGIYYAMTSGRFCAAAVDQFLQTANPRALRLARRKFMRANGLVFWILGVMQHFWYRNDRRRERFVTMCADRDVQKLVWQAYMNKRLVIANPFAHVRIFVKDVRHLVQTAR